MKNISIVVLIVFIFSNAAYGGEDCLYKNSLRAPLICGKGIFKNKAILPLQSSLYRTTFSKSIITDPEQIKQMIEKVHRDKLEGGYEPGSIVERAYSLDAINLTNCFVFEALRLRVICFEANASLAKILGYAKPEGRDDDQKFFDKAYMFSIENKKQEIVGHGILAYNSDMPGTALFRYSIHGSVHITHTHDFSRKGYGVEALLLMMIIAKRGEVFPEDINKLEYLLLEEDYSNSFGYLQRESNKDFYNMRDFLLRAGFVDETQFDLGRKHLPKDPVILYYMNKSQPTDIERLAQLVLNRLTKQDRRYGDSFLKIFTFTNIADIREYTYPVALEAGMAIPEDMDWHAFANLIWHKYRGESNESEPFSMNGVYFGKDLQWMQQNLLRVPMIAGKVMRQGGSSAEEVFKKVWGDDFFSKELLTSARMIDKIGINEKDSVLCVGPGNFWSHSVACAVKGAKVDIVQPARDEFFLNHHLQKFIDLNGRLIKLYYSIDILGNIDNHSYQTVLRDANVPERYYSYAFVLNVTEIIYNENAKEEFIIKLLSVLKDEASILISAWFANIQEEIGILQKYAKRLGYEIKLVNSFDGAPRVYQLKVFRNPKAEIPSKSPASQAL